MHKLDECRKNVLYCYVFIIHIRDNTDVYLCSRSCCMKETTETEFVVSQWGQSFKFINKERLILETDRNLRVVVRGLKNRSISTFLPCSVQKCCLIISSTCAIAAVEVVKHARR